MSAAAEVIDPAKVKLANQPAHMPRFVAQAMDDELEQHLTAELTYVSELANRYELATESDGVPVPIAAEDYNLFGESRWLSEEAEYLKGCAESAQVKAIFDRFEVDYYKEWWAFVQDPEFGSLFNSYVPRQGKRIQATVEGKGTWTLDALEHHLSVDLDRTVEADPDGPWPAAARVRIALPLPQVDLEQSIWFVPEHPDAANALLFGRRSLAATYLEGRGTGPDVYVHAGGQYEWDSAAPVAVARAAGLHTSRVDGSPLLYNQDEVRLPDLVVCRPELAEPILAFIRERGVE